MGNNQSLKAKIASVLEESNQQGLADAEKLVAQIEGYPGEHSDSPPQRTRAFYWAILAAIPADETITYWQMVLRDEATAASQN